MSLVHLPILLLLATLGDQAVNVKRINNGQNLGTGIIITRALDFRHAIFGKIDLVRAREHLHRMEDVEKSGIAVHEDRLKEPEEPFFLQKRTDVLDIGIGIQTRSCEIFNSAVDSSNGDECAARIQDEEGALDLLVQHPSSHAVVVESPGQHDEAHHQCDLHDEGGLEQGLAGVLLADGGVCAGHSDGSISRDGFDRRS